MSWYSTNYLQRAQVAIDLPVAAGGAGTNVQTDLEITVPPDFPAFWDNIRNDAFDVILVSPTNAILTFKRLTFDYANRQLTLQVDNFTYKNYESVGTCWLYWNYSSATDLASSFSASSPQNGMFFLERQ